MSIPDLIQIAIASVAAVTALITLFMMKDARKKFHADILFRLDEAFLRYENVREKLAPGGRWHRGVGGPDYKKSEDLIAISTYMGLFERIQGLIARGVITIVEFDGWYGDRLINIVLNSSIQDRLNKKKERWSDFIILWTALQEQREVSKRWFPKEAKVEKVLKCIQVPVNRRGVEVSSQLDSPAQPEVVEAQ